MQPPDTVAVVLPAYDVADAIPAVVRDLAVAAYAVRTRGMDLEVVLVNGDGDAARCPAQELAAQLSLPLTVLDGPSQGVGPALVQGLRHVVEGGRAGVVATLDATGRHDPAEIPRLLDLMLHSGADVVIGSRWAHGSGTPGLSVGRWVLGRLANVAFRVVTGVHGIADATTSFRLAKTEVVRDVGSPISSITAHSVQTHFVATAIAKGYRVIEGPIIYRRSIGGTGGLGVRDVAEFMMQLRELRRSAGAIRQRRLSRANRSFDDEHFGAADDLEQLGAAERFFEWVLDGFGDAFGRRILEVGAGTGTITRRLLERFSDAHVTALEPAGNMAGELLSFAALHPRVDARRAMLADGGIKAGSFDAVLYLNVLEHIADDVAELRMAAAALRPGGAVLVFGPAHEWLYSDLDHKAGHYRRYSVAQLRSVARSAGLEVESCRYFDVLGVAPYWLVYRFLRHTEITGSTTWAYDRLIVPLSRLLQRLLVDPPLGKNVLMVARKP